MEEVNELKAALERSSAALSIAQAAEKETLEELRQVREQIEEDEIRIEEALTLLQTSRKELILAAKEVAVAECVGRDRRHREEDISRQHDLVVRRVHERKAKFQRCVSRQRNFIEVLVKDMTGIRARERLLREQNPETEQGDWREVSVGAAALREEAQALQRRRALAVQKEESFLLAEISKVDLATQEKRGRRLRLETAVSQLPYPGRPRPSTSTSIQVQTHSLEFPQSPTGGQKSPPLRSHDSQSAFTTLRTRHVHSGCTPVSPEAVVATRKRGAADVANVAEEVEEAESLLVSQQRDRHGRALNRQLSWTASGDFYAACDEEIDAGLQP